MPCRATPFPVDVQIIKLLVQGSEVLADTRHTPETGGGVKKKVGKRA